MAAARARQLILLSATVVFALRMVSYLTKGSWPKARFFLGWALVYMFLSVWSDLRPREAGNFALLIMATAVLLEGPAAIQALQQSAQNTDKNQPGTGQTGPDGFPVLFRRKGTPPTLPPPPVPAPVPPVTVPGIPFLLRRPTPAPAPARAPRGFVPWPAWPGFFRRPQTGQVWSPRLGTLTAAQWQDYVAAHGGAAGAGGAGGASFPGPGAGPTTGPLPIPPELFFAP